MIPYLLTFALTCYGGATIIAQSKIFKPVRTWVKYRRYSDGYKTERANPLAILLSTLLHCPLCVGFWIGLLLGCMGLGPWEFLSLEDNFVTKIFDGFAGSAITWILYLMLADRMESR
jgi:hypothetical protein